MLPSSHSNTQAGAAQSALPTMPVAKQGIAVQDVNLGTLHKALLAGNQILTLGNGPLPPPAPPKPPAHTSYECVSGFCLQVAGAGGGSGNSSICGGTLCAGHTLGKLQWLAIPGHFTSPEKMGNAAWEMTAVLDTHIKKSEVRRSARFASLYSLFFFPLFLSLSLSLAHTHTHTLSFLFRFPAF